METRRLTNYTPVLSLVPHPKQIDDAFRNVELWNSLPSLHQAKIDD